MNQSGFHGMSCQVSRWPMLDMKLPIFISLPYLPILVGFLRGGDNWGTLRIPAGKIGEP